MEAFYCPQSFRGGGLHSRGYGMGCDFNCAGGMCGDCNAIDLMTGVLVYGSYNDEESIYLH